ncbi:alpha/beta hydrolase [Nocardiopsis sp. MG754419]|uniref:alpha/beta hydrolase n=1 Tax=Nocardiopsis sp. MG754419 TaxID=2259865 RepID=UPI001BAD6609|nr:alpha/beta hydrolase [Nocardiopsis sp. MG754419]MBR8744491.1 hypothetical protein [Nocardiopsis sp. MG754419]
MELDGNVVVGLIVRSLYQEWIWSDLAEALTALVDEDDEEIRRRFLWLCSILDMGTEEDARINQTSAMFAVECADSDQPVDLDAYRAAAEDAHTASEPFGSGVVWSAMVCAHWVEPAETVSEYSASDVPPILVIGTAGDPATPYEWSRRPADRLDGATLVTYEGAGHGVYGLDLNTCVDAVVDAYLLEAPSRPTVTPARPSSASRATGHVRRPVPSPVRHDGVGARPSRTCPVGGDEDERA